MDLEKINNIHFEKGNNVKNEYPDVTLTHLPQKILIMLKKIYAGTKGELTAINQYGYEHYIIWSNPKLNKLSETMQKISIQEMRHYELLAKILVRCGIDPKSCVYIDGNPNLCDYWKASNVSYAKTLTKMFENNILLEKRTIEDYNEVINVTDNENLKQILLRIVEEEEIHLRYFKDVFEALKN